MIETDLIARIRSDTAIAALIGSRIYPLVAPEGATKPNITYQLLSSERDRHLLGPSGLVHSTYQFDCWANTMDAARPLAEFLRLRLDNYAAITTGTHEIQRIKLVNALDNWEFAVDGSESIYGRVTQIYEIWYAETLPS